MRLKEAGAVKVVIHCVMHLVIRMQDGYEEFIRPYCSSSVDAVCLLYALLLSPVQIKAFMTSAVTAVHVVVVVKNFVKNTIHVVMRIDF